jgi:hypothetical protein
MLAIGLAAAVFIALSVQQAWTDAPTYDEPTYVVSGLLGWTKHDVRVTRQHPPLAKQLAALPILLLHPSIPLDPRWRTQRERPIDAAFVRAARRRGQLRQIFFVARLVSIAEGVAAGLLIAVLARRLFGPGAETLPALLWFLNPFTIGLSHVVGIDLPFTVTVLATALATAAARERPTTRRLVVVGLCAGLSLLTRLTGVFVVPAAAAAVMATPGERRMRRGVLVVAVAWATLAFVYAALAPTRALSEVFGTVGNLVVPRDWRAGAGYLLHVGSIPGPAFVLGRFHVGRWPLFWPASVLVKLPPLTVPAMVAATLAWWRCDRAVRRHASWVVGVPAVVLAAFTVQQQRPIGLRYLLATIALLFVATGAIAARRCLVSVVVGVAGLVSVATTPSLAWTSPLVRRPAYEIASDSNLDWGQGYYALRGWAAGKEPWVSYFGGAGLDVASIPGARRLGRGPSGVHGWVAVSASDLFVYRRRDLAWLRPLCVHQVLARTILVYEIDERGAPTGCGQVAPPAVPTRLKTRVTSRSRTSANAGSSAVHVASTGSR